MQRAYFIATPCGPRRPGGESGVEVELEALIFDQAVVRHLHHAHFVVAFKVDDSGVILVEKVVGNYQPRIVFRQFDVMRPGVLSEAHNRPGNLPQLGAIRGVEHANLTRPNKPEDQPVAALRRGHDLTHAAANRRLDVRCHGSEIERRSGGAVLRIDPYR